MNRNASWITGAYRTAYGRIEGMDTLGLMSISAQGALDEAGLTRPDIDAVLCGYSTTLPHLMLSTLFCEHFGLQPRYAHAIQLGGATGAALVMLAHELASGGRYRNILVVAGENRLSGQSGEAIARTLAQVGHAQYEVPLGASVPAYYALLASRYEHRYGLTAADRGALAVLMRRHAAATEGAQFRDPITVADVLASREIASPLRLLDCCAKADGAAAIVVSSAGRADRPVRIVGAGQAHLHQHVSMIEDIGRTGAAVAFERAASATGAVAADITLAGLYDSFTITLAMILEEIGLAERGSSGALAAEGHFGLEGRLPLNPHGGLLSYGHCGVAGAMAHVVELYLQMSGCAGHRQVRDPSLALLHADGGTMSSHVSLLLERADA